MVSRSGCKNHLLSKIVKIEKESECPFERGIETDGNEFYKMKESLRLFEKEGGGRKKN